MLCAVVPALCAYLVVHLKELSSCSHPGGILNVTLIAFVVVVVFCLFGLGVFFFFLGGGAGADWGSCIY